MDLLFTVEQSKPRVLIADHNNSIAASVALNPKLILLSALKSQTILDPREFLYRIYTADRRCVIGFSRILESAAFPSPIDRGTHAIPPRAFVYPPKPHESQTD